MNTKVGPHDGILVIHTGDSHLRWMGFWVECECGWISPSRKTEGAVWRLHTAHVQAGKS